MLHISQDASRTVAVFVNDYNPEYATALEKLSKTLKRPLQGVTLLYANVKKNNLHKPDTKGVFTEVVCDFTDIQSISSALLPYKDSLLLICVSSDRNQPYFKQLIPHAPYVYAPHESSIDWATNKIQMRQLFASHNPDITVKSQLLTEYSARIVNELSQSMQFPVIVKPNGLAASIMVTKAHTPEELSLHLERGFTTLHDVYRRDRGRGVPSIVVEEFIEGDMYSVDSYVSDNGTVWSLPLVKVTTAHSIGLEGFYSYQIDSDHGLSQSDIENAYHTAEQAAHALHLKSCVAHIELFKTKNGWKVIEVGPRAGGYRQDMYSLSYSVDHAYNELLIKVGLEPVINYEHQCYSSVLNIYSPKEGIIDSITGFDEALTTPHIHRLTLHSKPGDMALFCGNGGKFSVDGVLYDTDKDKLKQRIDSIRQTIKINIKD